MIQNFGGGDILFEDAEIFARSFAAAPRCSSILLGCGREIRKIKDCQLNHRIPEILRGQRNSS